MFYRVVLLLGMRLKVINCFPFKTSYYFLLRLEMANDFCNNAVNSSNVSSSNFLRSILIFFKCLFERNVNILFYLILF